MSRSYASTYFSRVFATTSSGSGGGGVSELRSQPDAGEVSQSRTYCLSYDGCGVPGLVAIGRPEARRVRRQHLVGEHDRACPDLALPAASELELRVGQDDAARSRDLLGATVGRERQALELVCRVGADRARRRRRARCSRRARRSAPSSTGVKSGSGSRDAVDEAGRERDARRPRRCACSRTSPSRSGSRARCTRPAACRGARRSSPVQRTRAARRSRSDGSARRRQAARTTRSTSPSGRAPLSGIGVGSTKSNAEMRSLATNSRRPSSIA